MAARPISKQKEVNGTLQEMQENVGESETLEITAVFYGTNSNPEPVYLTRLGLYLLGGLLLACIFRKIQGMYIPVNAVLIMLVLFIAIVFAGVFLRLWSRYETTLDISAEDWGWESSGQTNMIVNAVDANKNKVSVPLFRKSSKKMIEQSICVEGKATNAFKNSVSLLIEHFYGEKCYYIAKVTAKTKSEHSAR